MSENQNNQMYPIYEVKIAWIYNDNEKDYTNWKVMLKNELSNEEQQEKLNEYSELIKEKYEKKYQKEIKCITGSINLIDYETWCVEWFCHYTFDVGQNDEEVLNSFEEFVQRKKDSNEKNGHYSNEPNFKADLSKYYTLMGAEDRWRWYGGDAENQTNPPM